MSDDHDEKPGPGPSAKSAVDWVTVGPEDVGRRIDTFLCARLKGAPKSLIYRILRTGEVRVNKGRAKPDHRLRAGDLVRVPPLRLAADMPVAVGDTLKQALRDAVVHEDGALLVLNKPAGLTVHAGSGVRVGVIEALRALFPDLPDLELAHRLDRETSGLLVIAKTRPALSWLHELLRGDQVKKTYLALVHGAWPDRRAEVDAPLGKNALRGGERMAEVTLDGKPSVTRFRVRQRFSEVTLVEAMPITGRTHQIRVHAAHVGHPVAGDGKYGDGERDRGLKRHGLGRLFLHSARLHIPRPGTTDLRVEAPLPAELEAILASLGPARGT